MLEAIRIQLSARCASRLRALALLVVAGIACALAGAVPAVAEAARCAGQKATIVGGPGDNVISAAKQGPQVIVGGGGDDRIVSKRGKDVVCGGAGDDSLSTGTGTDMAYGGLGEDYMHLGPGRDKADAGGESDTVVGAAGGDRVRGGPGFDRMFGGIQDDHLFGDTDIDLLVGGQGIDRLHGGTDDDWIRGDSNSDLYFGDAGSDTLSFATATPPSPDPTLSGIDLHLQPGWARGDDSHEPIYGIENVVGTFFSDRLYGAGGGRVDGGYGPDECGGFAVIDCDRNTTAGPRVFIANPGSPDPGLVLMGGGGADDWTIGRSGSGYRVSGSGARAGPGCDPDGGGVVCDFTVPVGYVLAWGDGGGDSLAFANGFPEATVLKADGGPGDDTLRGSHGGDILWAGESGSDTLIGNGGDDALVARAGGADYLFGGSGNDQLVTNAPCTAHLYSGGGGKADVAGFAHTVTRGVVARMGGRGKLRGARCPGTRIRGNNEVLEGTRFADKLIASHRFDLLIGREGNDRCLGGRTRTC